MKHRQTPEWLLVQQEWNRGHLHHRLYFPGHGNSDGFMFADLGHPFSQCRHGNFTANDNDDRRDKGVQAPAQSVHLVIRQQQQQGHGYHQFVGNRVQKSTKMGELVQASRQVTVEPVGKGGKYKNIHGVAMSGSEWQIIDDDKYRDQADPDKRYNIWQAKHALFLFVENIIYFFCQFATNAGNTGNIFNPGPCQFLNATKIL